MEKMNVRKSTRDLLKALSKSELGRFCKTTCSGCSHWTLVADKEFSALRDIACRGESVDGKECRAHRKALTDALRNYGNHVRLLKEIDEIRKEAAK